MSMSDLITKIRAEIDLAERHADKDLALAAKCSTPPSTWTAWYGHNLSYSEIRIGEGESAEIVLGGSQHDSDAMLVSRAVRSIEERAKAAKRQVAAHREILAEHERICEQYNDPNRTEPMAAGPAYGLWLAITALAKGYGIEP